MDVVLQHENSDLLPYVYSFPNGTKDEEMDAAIAVFGDGKWSRSEMSRDEALLRQDQALTTQLDPTPSDAATPAVAKAEDKTESTQHKASSASKAKENS